MNESEGTTFGKTGGDQPEMKSSGHPGNTSNSKKYAHSNRKNLWSGFSPGNRLPLRLSINLKFLLHPMLQNFLNPFEKPGLLLG